MIRSIIQLETRSNRARLDMDRKRLNFLVLERFGARIESWIIIHNWKRFDTNCNPNALYYT